MTSEKTNILVAARVRPLLGKEGTEPSLHVSHAEGQSGCIMAERAGVNKQFSFDYVYGPESEQVDVFHAVKPLVESILDGYNATVFAYGQTGSGKTFTMGTDALSLSEAAVANPSTDNSNRRGVVSRATEYLFSMMSERRSSALSDGKPVPEFSVSVVFVEIYNDDVIDLLSAKAAAPAPSSSNSNLPGMKKAATVVKNKQSSKKANVRINENGDIVLDGVTTIACDSSTSVLSCLQEGSLARRTATTAYNERSSRSHAIFTIVVNQHRFIKPANTNVAASDNGAGNENAFDDLTDEVLVAKMHFVDLAGSERLHDAIVSTGQVAMERFREGVNINMGLLTLGKVISMLSEGKTAQHIPYRESKLTRLLQDSLGGNSRTLMIACVSAAECYVEQSINTLQYATNARKIKNEAVVNRASSVAQLRAEINMLRKRLDARGCNVDPELTAEVARLRQENDELRARISNLNDLLEQQERRTLERISARCENSTQTEPLALITAQDAALLAVSKLKAAKSPETGDSTLTDSKLQLATSFRHLYDRIVSEQAEVLALKEQITTAAPANAFSPNPGRFLSINSDIGMVREVRERRRKRNTEMMSSNNTSATSSNCITLNSVSDKEATPQPTEQAENWNFAYTTSSAVTNNTVDEDDEFRDPTYEPTPLRNSNDRGRRHFEFVQDAAGNRRLTRAAEKRQYEPEHLLPKKSRMAVEPTSETGETDGTQNLREYCRCHGLCKISSRCACKRNGHACFHSEDGQSGCDCDELVCVNNIVARTKNSGLASNATNEAVAVGAEKTQRESGGRRRN